VGIVLMAALVASLPEWKPVWYQSDQLPSVFRTLHTVLAHEHGLLFPRIACALGFGYGQLLHQVYAPLGFELTAWLHVLGLGYIAAVRMFFSLCLVGGALGVYAYARTILPDRTGAVLAACAHAWAPYVLLDAHAGGDFGESLAIALIPWSLLALHRLVLRGGWGRFGLAALGLALVLLAHNVTALFFTGLVGLYVAVLAARIAVRRGRAASLAPIGRSVAALGLALALSGLYWAPALFELAASRMSEQREGPFSATASLLPMNDLIQRAPIFSYDLADQQRFGLVQALLTVAGLIVLGAVVRRARRGPADLLVLAGCGVVFVGVLLLQVQGARPVWETVPLISFVQFPRRLFLFAALASALLIGAIPGLLGQLGVGPRIRGAVVGLVATLLAVAGLPGIYITPNVPPAHVLTEAMVGIGSSADRRFSQRTAYDDFFPVWVTERQVDIPRPPSKPALYRAASDLPAPRLRVLGRDYGWLRVLSDADTTSGLVLHQFYFPGWHATVDGAPAPVEPVGPLGLARVQIPPGRHEVVMSFGETPLRAAADAVSVVASVLLVAVLCRGLGVRRTLMGLAVLLLVVLVPWSARLASARTSRPALVPLDLVVTPSARVVGIEQGQHEYAPGETVSLTVLWQATAWTGADLQSGLRLVPSGGGTVDGAPLAERWDRPNLGRTPTAKWVLGELVPDDLSLAIPPGTPPGSYRLLAGLRDDQASALAEVAEVVVR
jgi:hypothetical protein